MRIVHLINSLATGGAENLVVNLASAMETRGHEVKILTLGAESGVPLEKAIDRGLEVQSLGRSARDLRGVVGARSALRGADVVHVHLFPALYVGPRRPTGAALVYTEHSTWNRRRDRRAFRRLDRHFYQRYDALVAISEGVRQELDKYLSTLTVQQKVEVIQNGIDDTFFVGNSSARKLPGYLRLIAVGTLDDRKNFSDAIRAVAAVPDCELTVVGDGPLRSALESEVVDLGVQDRIRLLGTRSDVRELMLVHDALLSTSRFEGFSLVAAESLALGRPVIGPAVPGFSESVIDRRTGLLYEPLVGSVASISEQIWELVRDDALYNSLADEARVDSQRFRISAVAEAYLDLYERVSGDRRSRSTE